MTKKPIDQAAKNIFTTKQIWLDKIDGVSNEMLQWMRNDCRERFRYCVATYYGDACHGIIHIGNLGEFLEQKSFEDIEAVPIGELQKIYDFATANQIQEILFY
jgi:hypothetical protein